MLGDLQRGVEHRFVVDGSGRFDAAGRRHDDGRAGVVDAGREFVAANPPNTTEWTAPSRAHASIAITASGTIGM